MDEEDHEVESFDVYGIQVGFEPMVGITIETAGDITWICWDDTVKLAEWLAQKVKDAQTEEARDAE